MALLKRLLRRRNAGAGQRLPRLKVVLMSATLDAALYSNYFGGCPGERRTPPAEAPSRNKGARLLGTPAERARRAFAHPHPSAPPLTAVLRTGRSTPAAPQCCRAPAAPSRSNVCSLRTFMSRPATDWTREPGEWMGGTIA
jgi:hypothetical protein